MLAVTPLNSAVGALMRLRFYMEALVQQPPRPPAPPAPAPAVAALQSSGENASVGRKVDQRY